MIPKPYKIKNDVIDSFQEQLELLFAYEIDHKKIDCPKVDENLGQVFTSPALAQFMIGLMSDSIEPTSSILDPCIGPNTFFNALSEDLKNCYLKGLEIDKQLVGIDTQRFYNHSKRELTIGSFFELPNTEKFDFIIENPPYVRQELLVSGANSKANIKNTLSSIIPSQSNLYIYFLLKSILHLNENGVMVAVIYDSWLYSNFGTFLKESFLKLGHLDSIYHFKKSAFEDIEVGATVIKFIKAKKHQKTISYYALNDLNDIKKYDGIHQKPSNLKQKDLLTYSFNNDNLIQTDTCLFSPLKSISTQAIQRGTSAIINNYFIFPKKIFSESIPIIKDVAKIKTYTVPEENAYILSINGSISVETKKYIDSVKEKIINTSSDKYRAVKKDIQSNKNWYKVKLKSCGNFIFNYYLRNNIDFLYNPNKKLSSDNFYSMNIDNNALSYLAILNSSFTRLNILNSSRSQGNGLRKIQLYKFKEIKIIDCKQLSKLVISQLEILGKKLFYLNRYKNEQRAIIEQIDSVLLTAYNEQTNSRLTLDELQNEIKKYVK